MAIAALAAGATPGMAAEKPHVEISSRTLSVQHITVTTTKPYAQVTAFIEGSLGRFDAPMHEMLRKGETKQLRRAAERIIAHYGLSIHYIAYHGKLLILNGPPEKLKTYYIGDLLSASAMTRAARAAGLYAPLRVVVYENAQGGTTLEYDQPSSLFGQFHTEVTDRTGRKLDGLLAHFIHDAAS